MRCSPCPVVGGNAQQDYYFKNEVEPDAGAKNNAPHVQSVVSRELQKDCGNAERGSNKGAGLQFNS